MNQKDKFEPKAIVERIHSDIEQINNALDENDFSDKALENIQDASLKLELQAYKTKIGFKLHKLSKSSTEMTARNILIQMLDSLPANINKSFLPELTLFILKEWDILNTKLAA